MPLTWTWCIQYCGCWYCFEKHPGRVWYIACNILQHLDRSSVLRLFGLQYLKLQWVINICLLYVISRFTWLGLFAFIVLWSTTNTSFYHVLLLIIRILYLSHKYQIGLFLIFYYIIFAADKYIYKLPKYLITNNKQTFKQVPISGVGRSLWGISWLWFKYFGFSET